MLKTIIINILSFLGITNKELELENELVELPENIMNDLVELGQILLKQSQDAFGYLHSSTRHVIGYSDPEERNRVQNNLNHAVSLLSVAHVMSIFEQKLPSIYWNLVLEPNDIELIKAYRHIRQCACNGFTGIRSDIDYLEFDSIMTSDTPLSGIEFYDDKSIVLNEHIGLNALEFIRRITDKAIVSASNIGVN